MNMQTTQEPPSPSDDPTTLVSTSWLAARLKDTDLRLFDASWYLPAMERDPRAEYEAGHIPGTRFFDIDDISDHRSDLPHMVPPLEKFASRLRAMGVGDGHQVVVYDGMGIFSAARVWWLCRIMGMPQVAVLDGGLPKWQADGHKVTDRATHIKDRHAVLRYNGDMVKDVTQVARASKLGDHVIIDARAGARFRGEAAEPRPGMRSGHIPGSRNVFFQDLLAKDGTMLPPDACRAVFEAAGVNLDKPAITTCGSGVTAAVLSLALERMGLRNHALYDGSWSEWGIYADLGLATGEA